MLKKRLNNKKGFTLAELLVAVAIIGILVAISVPVFTSKLGDARKATDDANIRAAKAAGVTKSLEGNITQDTSFYYDADAGVLKDAKAGIKAYSKEDANKVIKVTISKDGTVTTVWDTVGQ